MKHGQKGGLHPADCKCGRVGCWSNTTWLKARVARAIKEGKPLPSSWPEKYRNLIIQDASGETVATSNDGQVPSVTEQVEGALKTPRKALPMPSEVTQRTIVTDQVPLRANWPFRALAKGVNTMQKHAEPPAPPEAMMDDSIENEQLGNEYFQRAYPNIMVSPQMAFWIWFVTWWIPPAFYWIPKWLKGKFKNIKWPWSKKAPVDPNLIEKPPEPKPEVPK